MQIITLLFKKTPLNFRWLLFYGVIIYDSDGCATKKFAHIYI